MRSHVRWKLKGWRSFTSVNPMLPDFAIALSWRMVLTMRPYETQPMLGLESSDSPMYSRRASESAGSSGQRGLEFSFSPLLLGQNAWHEVAHTDLLIQKVFTWTEEQFSRNRSLAATFCFLLSPQDTSEAKEKEPDSFLRRFVHFRMQDGSRLNDQRLSVCSLSFSRKFANDLLALTFFFGSNCGQMGQNMKKYKHGKNTWVLAQECDPERTTYLELMDDYARTRLKNTSQTILY